MSGRIAAEALILRPDGAWLVHRRGPLCRDEVGLLEGFGGDLEPGETPRQAVLREVREELGETARAHLVADLPEKRVTVEESGETWLIHSYVFAWEGGELAPEPGLNDGFVWLPAARWRGVDPGAVADGTLSGSARMSAQALTRWVDADGGLDVVERSVTREGTPT